MPPLNLLIKPSSSLCNMCCEYCFYKDVSENRAHHSFGIMTTDTLEIIVKRAFEYASGYVGFAFQGGEPTLAGLNFYEELIRLQRKYNEKKIKVSNSIQTNGYILDDTWARFFSENSFLVGVSLDGTKEAHNALRVDSKGQGTFERVLKAVEILEKNQVEFNILCVVNNFVARYPKRVYEQLKKYKNIQFIACLDPLKGEKTRFSLTADRYENFLKQTFALYYADFMSGNYVSIRNFDNYINILLGNPPENCAMNGFCTCYCVIEGDGSVYPCDFYVLDEWKLGNVQEDGFEDMIHSDTAKRFVEKSFYVCEECKNCQYYQICRGGCRRDREPFSDGHPVLNKYCKAYRGFFESSIIGMQEIANKIRIESIMQH